MPVLNRHSDFSIIIDALRFTEKLPSCLDLLKKNSERFTGIIVIVEESYDLNLQTETGITVLRKNAVESFAAGINRALRFASGDLLVISACGSDLTANPVDQFNEISSLNFSLGLFPYTNDIESMAALSRALEESSLFMKQEIIESIGGFDERFNSKIIGVFEYFNRAIKSGFTVNLDKLFRNRAEILDIAGANEDDTVQDDRKKLAQKWGIDLKPTGMKSFDSGYLTDEVCTKLLDEGNKFALENRFEESLTKYRKILESRPNHSDALYNESIILYQSGKQSEGLDGLHRLLKIDPEFPQTYYSLGLIDEESGRFPEALDRYKNCISKNVIHDEAYSAYKRTAEKMGMSAREDEADYVFYTGGMKFDGSTIRSRGLGGSESALYYAAKSLASKGFKVKVFNNCDKPGIYDGVEYKDIVDFYLYFRWSRAKIFISSRSFRPFALDIKVDADLKFVWLHDMPDVAYVSEYDFKKMDLSDLHFITLSNYQTDHWQKYLGIDRERFFISRNGYDPERFKVMTVPRKKYKLIYASRPVRGLDVLTEIFPKIRESVPQAELHVFSYIVSEKDTEIKSLSGKLKQPGIIVRGGIPQSELAKEMAESRLLVYPSTFNETSCIVAIQAQAAGLPVITSTAGALPETVLNGKGGVIIDGDPRSEKFRNKFADIVVRLLNDEDEWSKLSESGRGRMKDNYTWNKVADEWISEFSELQRSLNPTEKLETTGDSPSLSLCMIVKNEGTTLAKCLESVKNIVDEIIIVDTGSDDNTLKIAGEYGAKIYHFEWRDDFSAARNESIKHATGDWILYLDADEMISPENAERIRAAIRDHSLMAVNMIEHIPQEEGNLFKTAASDYCRLFRNDSRLRFTGRVHEQILPSINEAGGKTLKSSIRIDHWGFGISDEKKREREKRNLRLLLLEEKDNPRDPFVHFNLGMTYKSMGDLNNAITHLESAVNIDDDSVKDSIRASAFAAIAQLAFQMNDNEKARLYAEKAIVIEEKNQFAHYILAGLDFQDENYSEAETNLLKILDLTQSESSQSVIDISQIHIDLGNCSFNMGKYEKAVDSYLSAEKQKNESFELMYNLGICYININDLDAAERCLTKASAINPENSTVGQYLDEISKLRTADK